MQKKNIAERNSWLLALPISDDKIECARTPFVRWIADVWHSSLTFIVVAASLRSQYDSKLIEDGLAANPRMAFFGHRPVKLADRWA
jgi:hypothetical protein